MALTKVIAIGNGVTDTFALNFALGYISKDHITCRVDNEKDGAGNPVYRSLTFLNDNLVKVSGAVPALNAKVRFLRTVPKTNLIIDFDNGDTLEEANLDTAQKQSAMQAQEALDGRISFSDDLSMAGFKLTDVADPVNDNDAVTKKWAETSQTSLLAATRAAKAAAEEAMRLAIIAKNLAEQYAGEIVGGDLDIRVTGNTNPSASTSIKSVDGNLRFKYPDWKPPNTLSEEFAGSIETGPISIDLVRTGGFGSYGNIYLTSRITAPTPATQFDFGLGCYVSSNNLVGGGVGGAWIGANSPSTGTDYGGNPLTQYWTSGAVSAMEINTGNRWGELGQQRDWNRAPKWTNGITIVPAIVPATDGPGNNAHHGTFGTSLLKDSLSPAKWWTGHLVSRDAIVPGGTALQINGGFTEASAYDIMCVEGYYRYGIDLTRGEFISSQIQGPGWSVGNRGNLTSLAEISAYTFISKPQTPSSASAAGTTGQWCSDSNYFYVCVATDTWKRTPISTW